jgi:hypothetical protein
MQTTTATPVRFDSGERAMVIDEPFSVTYECARCHTFAADTEPHSHWNGERWVRRHYCGDCIEAAI